MYLDFATRDRNQFLVIINTRKKIDMIATRSMCPASFKRRLVEKLQQQEPISLEHSTKFCLSRLADLPLTTLTRIKISSYTDGMNHLRTITGDMLQTDVIETTIILELCSFLKKSV